VLLNCGIDFRFGIYPCSGLGVLERSNFWKFSGRFLLFSVFFLVGFLASVFHLASSPHHLSGLFSQAASGLLRML
jgi:hypothetical protein